MHRPNSDPAEVSRSLDRSFQFTELYRNDPLLGNRQGDLWQMFEHLAKDLVLLADQKDNPELLAKAERSWEKAKSSYTPPKGTSAKDAEKFAAEDHTRREAAEARNAGDQLSYQIDRSLQEWGEKVQEADREELKKANDELKEALKGEDVARIRSATEATMQVFSRIGQAMYQQTQAQAGPQQGPAESASEGGEGDVVEGEIVDEGSGS